MKHIDPMGLSSGYAHQLGWLLSGGGVTVWGVISGGYSPRNHWSTGWIVPALYQLEWRLSATLNNFRCQLSRRFRAYRSHWQGVLCDVLGVNTVVNNNNSINSRILLLLLVLLMNVIATL